MSPGQIALLSLFCAVLLLAFLGFDHGSILAYDRPSLQQGQIWRLFTAHFVHLNITHTLLNIAVLPVIIYLYYIAQISANLSLFILVPSALVVSLCLWLFSPAVNWYVGFSGITHGLLCFVLLRLGSPINFIFSLMFLLLLGKVLIEQCCASAYLVEYLGHPVVYDAHLYGFMGGVMLFGVLGFYQSRFRRELPLE